jgi:hypothetical protein
MSSNQVKKSFCKVCQDAGKPEREYTNHYVRSLPDKNGNTIVTCPTLLSTQCRYCNKLGHTSKFCPVSANNKKAEEKSIQKAKYISNTNANANANTIKTPINKSYFEVLKDDVKPINPINKNVNKKEAFPVLTEPKKKVIEQKPAKNSWASIVAKTEVEYEIKKYEEQFIATTESTRKLALIHPNALKNSRTQTPTPTPTPTIKKRWADYSDSEDEEDQDYQDYQEYPEDYQQDNYCTPQDW